MNKNLDLFISIGNTRTSFAVFEKSIDNIKIIKKNTKLFFNTMDFEKIFDFLNVNVQKIFVCSVVEYANKKLLLFFKDKEVIFLTSSNQNLIKLNLLDNPNEVGNDILASAIYANILSKNIIIASLGTATVISNVVNGSLIGCIIFPGLGISYKSLITNTMIKKIELNWTNKDIGTNTKDALSIGVIKGHQIIIKELSKPFHTIDTLYIYFGGNAPYIKLKGWKKIEDIDILGLYLFSLSR